MNDRKLRVESLEERTLLAVLAGGADMGSEFIPAPAPSEAVTWVVNTTEDPTSWNTGDSQLSLREAIFRAAAGDTILFDAALAGRTITLRGTEFLISECITIDATEIGGITIDGNGRGRVFYVTGGTVEDPVDLVALTITRGKAAGGGGIANEGSLSLTNCTVKGNNARYSDGGGVANGRGTLTLTDCVISGNTASNGGGVVNYSGTLNLTDCVISGNTAGSGGGIYNYEGSLGLTSCTILGNTAAGYGGGLYNSSTLSLTNCTILGNTAGGSGGGIINSSTLTLTNCTVAGNTAGSGDGGGIYNNETSYLYNSIVRGVSNDGTIRAYNTLSEFTAWTESSGCLIYDPSKPLFADPENNDYTLARGPQAINRGNNDYVTVETDLAGNPRIRNDIVDLGAYEYQGALEPFATPVLLTGEPGVYVSYGANRHRITWNAVEDAGDYELSYSADGGLTWSVVAAFESSAVVPGLSYGAEMTYRVRALASGAHADSEWSAPKTFMVCPMDVNGDGDISGADRALLLTAWLAEEGEDNFLPCCDIDGNGNITNGDRAFLSRNWLSEAGDEGLLYPAPLASDAVLGEYASADLEVGLDDF